MQLSERIAWPRTIRIDICDHNLPRALGDTRHAIQALDRCGKRKVSQRLALLESEDISRQQLVDHNAIMPALSELEQLVALRDIQWIVELSQGPL